MVLTKRHSEIFKYLLHSGFGIRDANLKSRVRQNGSQEDRFFIGFMSFLIPFTHNSRIDGKFMRLFFRNMTSLVVCICNMYFVMVELNSRFERYAEINSKNFT